MTQLRSIQRQNGRRFSPFSAMMASTTAAMVSYALQSLITISEAASVKVVPSLPNPCIASWTGPSADNSFDCDGTVVKDWALDHRLWQFAIPLAIGLLLCVPGCCIVLCGRHCCNCLGSRKMRPGHVCCGGADLDLLGEPEKLRMYGKGCITATRVLAFVAALIGLVGLALSVAGGIKLALGAGDVVSDGNDLVSWFLQIVTDARNGIKDPTSGQYPAGYDLTQFDDVVDMVTGRQKEYLEDGYETYKPIILVVALIPSLLAVIPFALLVLPAISAVMGKRDVLPQIFIVAAFPCQLIYFFVVTLLFVLLVPLTMANDDINAKNGEKSVTQWYLLPMCDDAAPFQSIIDNVNTMEHDSSVAACEKLQEICDANTAFNPLNYQKIFFCTITDPSTDCTTVEDLNTVVDAMYIKSGVMSPYGCATHTNAECTFRVCAEDCEQTDVKDSAAGAVTQLDTATRVLNTFRTVLEPWMDCTVLFNKVMTLGPKKVVQTLGDGLSLFAVGSIIVAASLVIGVVIALLGQKRFITDDEFAKALLYDAEKGGYKKGDDGNYQQGNRHDPSAYTNALAGQQPHGTPIMMGEPYYGNNMNAAEMAAMSSPRLKLEGSQPSPAFTCTNPPYSGAEEQQYSVTSPHTCP